MKTLVIGYGNTLRGDDGVGPVVAQQLAMWNLPQVQSFAVHQLTPELAENLSKVDMVCFVDAWRQARGAPEQDCKIEQLSPNPSNSLDHHWSPNRLLSLTQRLYNHCPRAYHLLIPSVNFDYSETLSPYAIQGVYWAIQTIKTMISSEAYCYA